MELIANSMKAGQSVTQALSSVTDNAGPPMSDEFGLARREIELGASIESALTSMVKRIGSADLRLVVMVITIQHSVGGDLPAILITLSDTMKQRAETRAEILASTAQSRSVGLDHHAAADRRRPPALFPRAQLLSADVHEPDRMGDPGPRRSPPPHRQPRHPEADEDRMNPIPLLIGVLAAAGVYILAVGIVAARAGDAATMARERLARQEIGLGQNAVALELERPLGERLSAPLRRWLRLQLERLTPAAQAKNFHRQLDFVGNPFGLDPAGVQALRIAAAAGLGALGVAFGVLLGTPVAVAVSLLIGVAAGFYLPVVWLDQLARQRRTELEASLPNALDVVAISMEAGLGLDRALEQLVRHQEGSLTLLVARALREIELGRSRAEALEEMALATGIEDFTSLVRGILHAERTGVPIARTIAAHSAQMRVKRRLQIRTEAARASLKILLPTVGCVFPTLWLILLGPALIVVLAINH